MLGLEFIRKSVMGLIFLFVVLALIYNLVPGAMKEYLDNTALGKILPDFSVGEMTKHESEFEIPSEMEDNIKKIDRWVSRELEWDLEGDIVKKIELNEFKESDQDYKLTIKKGYYIVENSKQQKAYYENKLSAIPCLVEINDPNYMGGILNNDNKYEKTFVDSITLTSKNNIGVDNKNCEFKGLVKLGNSICFVYLIPLDTGMYISP